MTQRIIPVEPFDYVVFGGTGDLAKRKLLPALYHRFLDGQFDERSNIIGVSRSELDTEGYRNMAAQALDEFLPDISKDKDKIGAFLSSLSYVTNDVTNQAGWAELQNILEQGQESKIRAFYLAVSPSIYGSICDNLQTAGFWSEDARIVLEKPLGHDFASAEKINNDVGVIFSEDQIYRIDHYLGKETVQNLLALRFANVLFEPIWNSQHIDHIQITAAETVGLGSRAGYYNTSGATRDMVQNHLLQLLCLVAMEPPSSENANAVRDEKLKVLNSLQPIIGGHIDDKCIAGQYDRGYINGVDVPSYIDELDGESTIETFVAMKADIMNWRWQGTPFYLRTGKRLEKRVSEIVIQFRDIPHSIFNPNAGKIVPNKLVIRLQPDEGVRMYLMIKDPGPGGMRLKNAPLNLSFADTFSSRFPDAYERLLMDVIRGNQTLFMRRDEVAAAWRWVDPIIAHWQQRGHMPELYKAGSWGPSGAISLIERDGRSWYEKNRL